ncbi:hypothetical protein BH10PSE12_BH10PSE12_02980 [soil metagenome]
MAVLVVLTILYLWAGAWFVASNAEQVRACIRRDFGFIHEGGFMRASIRAGLLWPLFMLKRGGQ